MEAEPPLEIVICVDDGSCLNLDDDIGLVDPTVDLSIVPP